MPTGFRAFADLYGKGRSDKAAGDTILHVYDFLRALPDYDRKLDEFLEPWQAGYGFDATCWHDLLLAEAARTARAGRSCSAPPGTTAKKTSSGPHRGRE